MRILRTLVCLPLLAACSDATDPWSDGELIALARASGRWEGAGLTDYTFEQRRLCFCPPGYAEWARVTVRGGKITSVEPVDSTGTATLGDRLTVPQLFEILRNSRSDEFVADVEVEFDPQFGYPLEIHFRARVDVTDGGLTIQTRALMPLN